MLEAGGAQKNQSFHLGGGLDGGLGLAIRACVCVQTVVCAQAHWSGPFPNEKEKKGKFVVEINPKSELEKEVSDDNNN